MKVFITALIMISLTIVDGYGQMCNNYHRDKKYCPPSKDGFLYNGQSRSAYFYKGQTSELNAVFHAQQDYRITFCAEESLGDRIEFKIKDGKTGELLYDNADEDFAQTFEFRCEQTIRLTLDITVPDEGEGGSSKLSRLKSTSSGCLGVLIEHIATQRAGF